MSRLVSIALAAVLAGNSAACSTDDTTLSPGASGDTRVLDRGLESRTPATLSLEKIGGFSGGGVGAAEITAFDSKSQRLFVVNGALGTVDVLDLSDPSAPRKVATISVAQFGGGANSVAVHDGVVALAIEAAVKQNPGTVAFYDASTLGLLSSATVGALPDMVTFTRGGRLVLVANEGEPNDAYTIDPEGSVSIIDVRNIREPSVRTVGFAQFNGMAAELRSSGIRIFGPNATVAQDLEPEYITIDDEDRTAFVTLQENNAIAVIDIQRGTVIRLLPLGLKNHSLAGNGLDAGDRDGPGNTPLLAIRNRPVFGMYQPDAIASYRVRGRTYLITANEGDSRSYAGFDEEARVGTASYLLNPAAFPDADCGGVACKSNAALGRLTVTTTLGRNAATGQYDSIVAFGARSFSIWAEDGSQVYDSGDDLEQRTTSLPNVMFNAGHDNNNLDDRSDNKGPEPEGVVVGTFGRKTFAFIGLERVGGVMVYDVTRPTAPVFTTYLNTRLGAGGDLGPEGLALIPAKDSPNGKPLLIVGHEISGTTAVVQINLH